MDQGDFIMGGIAAVWGGFSSFLNLAGMPFADQLVLSLLLLAFTWQQLKKS